MLRSLSAIVFAVFLCGSGAAIAQPAADGVPFLIRFTGSIHGLAPGASVEVAGLRIGVVRRVGVEYSADSNSFVAPVEIRVEPGLFPAAATRPVNAEQTYAAADMLVQRGLRAIVMDSQLFGGGETVVSLVLLPGASPKTLDRSGAVPVLPSGPSPREAIAAEIQPLLRKLADAPIDRVFADMEASMAALKALATGPELRGALDELQQAAAEMKGVAGHLGARSDALMDRLGETVRSVTRMIDTLDRQVGDRSPVLADIRNLLHELDGAARSMRLMTEYLERHPDALIRGKSDIRQ